MNAMVKSLDTWNWLFGQQFMQANGREIIKAPQIAKFMGPHGAHLGPTGPILTLLTLLSGSLLVTLGESPVDSALKQIISNVESISLS